MKYKCLEFCDFENNFCGYEQDASDDFDWSRGHANTTSIATQGEAHTNRTMTGQTAERRPGTAIEFTIQCSGGFGGSDFGLGLSRTFSHV